MTAIEIIRANPGLTAQELAAKFGKTASSYHNAARRNGIPLMLVPREESIRRSVAKNKTRAARNADFIRQHFGEMSDGDIAAALGLRNMQSVAQIARRLGLKRTPEQAAARREQTAEKLRQAQKRATAYHHGRQLRGLEAPSFRWNVFSSTRRLKVRVRLVRTYGYIYLEGDSTNLGYDSTTDRCTEAHHSGSPLRKPEEFYTRKYGIHFYDLDE